ncbi:MAG: ASCH domain-containing protein [Nitrospinae bacterium]|nr:ASCH domain-containing protein [Nitrospinota bacterium]
MIATTIKREYLEQIKAGTKTIEYRANSAFWQKRVNGKFHSIIMFLCGRKCNAFRVIKIETIETPDAVKAIIQTPQCFAIHLGGGLIDGQNN